MRCVLVSVLLCGHDDYCHRLFPFTPKFLNVFILVALCTSFWCSIRERCIPFPAECVNVFCNVLNGRLSFLFIQIWFYILWRAVVPLTVTACGYFPAKAFRLFEVFTCLPYRLSRTLFTPQLFFCFVSVCLICVLYLFVFASFFRFVSC